MTVDRLVETNPTEADLVLSAFVAEHYGRLLGLARLVCADANDAADAVQGGIEQAWRKRESLRDAQRVRPWLDRIVVREAIRVSKRRRFWLGRILSAAREVPPNEPPDGRASDPPTHAALRAAFGALAPEQRAVITLHLHLGYSVSETASLVGAPEETVRSRLRLARRRLRRELEDHDHV